jgi:hypothetical protein
MRAGIPSDHNEYPKSQSCLHKRHLDFGLRPWSVVAEMYTERTGEAMNDKLAENVHGRAIKKLRAVLGKASNAEILEALRAELS